MKKIIGIMGPGKDATEKDIENGYLLGQLVGKSGAVLLSGGMQTGVMESSCRGAHEVGGMVLGISPNDDKSTFNEYIDIPVLTAMRSGRNYINILSCDIVIAVGNMSPGTLSEVAFAIALNKPLIIFGGSVEMLTYIKQIAKSNVHFTSDISDAEKVLSEYLKINA